MLFRSEVIVFYKKQLSKNGWTVKEDDGFLRVYNTDYDGKIKLSRVTGDVNTLTINYILCKER